MSKLYLFTKICVFVAFFLFFVSCQDEFDDLHNNGATKSGSYSMKKAPDQNKCLKNKYGLKKLMN